MTDAVTANKAFAQPTRGSDVGTWDTPMNANTSALDALLGSGQAVSITTADVTLNQTQANNLYFICTGVLTGNRNLIFPAIGGMFVISNQTTGAFTLSVLTAAGGSTPLVIPQGAVQLVYLDGTNANVAAAAPSIIPSGTAVLFYQAAAPVGWTQVTSVNNYVLRVVSGAGAVIHGTVGLPTFISGGTLSHVLALTEIPAHKHTLVDPGHEHDVILPQGAAGGSNVNVCFSPPGGGDHTYPSAAQNATTGITMNNAGGGLGHTHSFADLAYADVIVCTKN